MNLDWYKKAMALDPQAWKTDPQPARLREHQDFDVTPFSNFKIPQPQNQENLESLYSGVHFAYTPEQAAIYACGKATESDPPVIIEVDSHQMPQQPDVDATVDKKLVYYIDDKKEKWSSILSSKKNPEVISSQLMEDLDHDKDSWEDQDELEDVMDVVSQEQMPIPPSVLESYMNGKTAKQIIQVFRSLIRGKIPDDMLMRMVGQFRVNKSIGSQRVKGIYQVPWIYMGARVETALYDVSDEFLEEQGWHRDGDEVKNERGQIIPDYEDLIYNHWLSKTPLYVNHQMSFPGYSSEESVWHGTTLSRAKSAFPDLLGVGSAPVLSETSKTKYNLYEANLEKKDLTASLSKNYRKANEEKPYRMVRIVNGQPVDIRAIKGVRINATSPDEAFGIFLRNYDWLKNFIDQGFKIEAIVDDELWQHNIKIQEVEEIDKEKRRVKVPLKNLDVQEMWWNKK